MVATAATSVLLLVSGTLALTPQSQPTSQEVNVATTTAISSPIHPEGIEWEDLLNRDPELTDLASCESQFDPNAINLKDAAITGHPSYGLFQYQPGTFVKAVIKYNAMPGKSDSEILASIDDPYIQIYITRKMLDDKQGHQWTCYNTEHLAQKYPWTPTPPAIDSKSLG